MPAGKKSKTARTARPAKKAPPRTKTAARKAATKPGKKPAPAMTEAEMMAQWQKAMTPSAGHKRLEAMVGTFQARTTFIMGPGAPPSVSDGVSEHRWVLGGRFVEQHYKGTSMGMPFEGLGFTGYDNVQGKYVGTWMDSFGTGIMHSEGVGKPSDKRIDSVARCYEPSGRQVEFECIARVGDHDHHSFEMWCKDPSGKKFRAMLIEYTRK